MTTTATATMPTTMRGDTNEAVLCSCLANLILHRIYGLGYYEETPNSREWYVLGPTFWKLIDRGHAAFVETPAGRSTGIVRVRVTDKGRAWLRAQRWEGGAA